MLFKIEICVKDILIWCTKNGLACNSDKTEVIHLTSRFTKHHEEIRGIYINDVTIVPKSTARDLGVIVDSHLQMSEHVNNVCKSAYFSLRNIGKIRKYINQEECERLVHAFITSKLDTCNSILFRLPAIEVDKLQRAQNTAPKLVARSKKNEHITPVLKRLHWLPIRARIDFKILLITYKALDNQAPIYIKDLLSSYRPSRSLRSASKNVLLVPPSNTKSYGDRAFQVAAPRLWNFMPDNIRFSNSLGSFKGLVKTYLFSKYFI